MKKTLITLLLILSLAVVALTGCNLMADDTDALMKTSASVVTLDVNPSVRVYLASDDTVVEVEALTEDGEAVVSEVEASVEGETLDTAVEVIVDELFDKGYLGEESNSVLVSIDKEAKELNEKVSEKIKKTFEKHGKEACVIMQKLEELDEDTKEKLDELSKKYNISEGKARMIEKIREDFPELSEKELSDLKMNDLALVFNGASEKIRGEFEKIGETLEDMYIGNKAALEAALADAGIAEDDLVFKRVRISREDGKMVYEVEFATEGVEYEYELDAATGEILDSESEEHTLPDVDGELDKLYQNHREALEKLLDKSGFDKDSIDKVLGDMHHCKPGADEDKPDHEENKRPEPISRGEAISALLEALNITKESVKDTGFRIHEGKGGKIISVTVELEDGTVYRAQLEAFSGMIIKAQMNGVEITIEADATEQPAEGATESPETSETTETTETTEGEAA